MWLTRVSVANPVFATMMMVGLVVLGAFSYMRLGVDEFPAVDFPVVVVSTDYPGAGPEAIESDVTRPIEDAVNAVAGVKELTSRSIYGRSAVIAQFNLDISSQQALIDVREKIAAIRSTLRDGVKEPQVFRFDDADQPVVSVVVRSPIRSNEDLTILADQVIRKRLETVPGTGRVTIVGGVQRQIQIQLKPEALRALGVGVDEVVRAVRNENQDLPAGSLIRQADDRSVEIRGRILDPRGFLEIIVARRGGTPVYLRQVADVVDGPEEEQNFALLDGARVLALDVVKVKGENTIAVVDGVRAMVDELKHSNLPRDVTLEVIQDGSRSIRLSVADVESTMIEGAVLTVLIVSLFLGSWRSTVITGLTLPVAVIGTFMVLRLCHYTINTMSLMALSLAVGILIDDAIVVRENITRHREMGKSHVQAALDGTEEIGLAVLATTLSIVAVFLPIAFMGGIIGRFFTQFGVTVAAAVMISLFVSFTLDPMLSSIWREPVGKRPDPLQRLSNALARPAGWVQGRYLAMLDWSLRHRLIVMAGAVLIFVAGLALPAAGLIGTEFAPDSDMSELQVSMRTPVGSSIEYTQSKVAQVQSALKEFPEVRYSYGIVNTGAASNPNFGSIYVRLVDVGARRAGIKDIQARMRQRLKRIAAVETYVTVPGITGDDKAVQVSLQGPDLRELERLSTRMLDIVASTPGAVDVESSLKASYPTLAVRLRRDLASDLGLGLQEVYDTLRPLVAGDEAGNWKDASGQNYSVVVRLPRGARANTADLDRVYIAARNLTATADGMPNMIALSEVAEIDPELGQARINRRDQQREVLISANVQGRSVGEVSSEVAARMKSLTLPPGYSLVSEGSQKDMIESAGYAGSALFLGIIFIYLILASQFGSFLQPLAIMASLPLSLIGVFGGLLIAHSTLNLFSAIGFIMLMGLVTKNAILLVDFTNKSRADGLDLITAIKAAATVRLRPIVMTTCAMIFGMLPLALGLGEGSGTRAPMAHAVIGGLISSTLLTLLVVPVLLTWLGAGRPHRVGSPVARSSNLDAALARG